MTAIRFAPEPLEPQGEDALLQREFNMLFTRIQSLVKQNKFGTNVRPVAVENMSRHHRIPSSTALVCSKTMIQATIEEVAELFCSNQMHLDTGFAQSQQIYSFVEPSAEFPLRSAGVRWTLWEPPTRLVRPRDLFYVEYMDAFVDEHGRRGWARCTRSIVHRSCPDLTHSRKIIRADMACSGTIGLETSLPGILQFMTLYDIDTKRLPVWLTKLAALRKSRMPNK